MTARRIAAGLAVVAALGLLVVALLTPLRADRIAALDAEADRLGREWTQDQGNTALVRESNEYFDRARALEPPLAPAVAVGGALLAAALAVGLWPGRPAGDHGPETPMTRPDTAGDER